MQRKNLAILGAGNIAHMMAKTVAGMDDVQIIAVASRSYDKAKAFADTYGIKKAYGSYEEMVRDDEVDLVYVATPHSHHFEHMKLCVENGKNVLCEKAFTWNAQQARDIKALAAERNVYVTEAIWPRYMPSRKLINDIIDSGIIGKVTTITCNLSYNIAGVERIYKKELAGGALLDLGVYGLNFLLMHARSEIERFETSVVMTDTGVDGQETITLFFKNGIMGVTTHSIYSRSDRKGIFHGENGYIVVENINNPEIIRVFDGGDNLLKEIPVPKQITGYEYEVWESFDQLEKGKTESESMPLNQSIELMQLMDDVKAAWNR